MEDVLTERGAIQTGYRLTPLATAFDAVTRGADPWLVLGDFLDDWRRADIEQREELMRAPLIVAPEADDDTRRWAALFAAVADWLCWRNDPRLARPSWVDQAVFRLDRPWFVMPGQKMRLWQLVHSPAPFRLRNVFTDESVVARA
jgi:hypothetical protein